MHHPALFGWLNTHVMRKTRSSACRRSGFLFAGICAIHMGLPATGWTQTTTPPASPPAHAASQHSSSIAEQIKQLSTALAHAKTPEEAHTLQEQLEALRSAKLSPTTQLLVRRAEKDRSISERAGLYSLDMTGTSPQDLVLSMRHVTGWTTWKRSKLIVVATRQMALIPMRQRFR